MRIENFDEYLSFNESVKFSDDFRTVLKRMALKGDKLSQRILNAENIPVTSRYDFIDINSDPSLISFIPFEKTIKSDVKIGRLIQKLCDDYEIDTNPRYIESFVNKYRGEVSLMSSDFELVNGMNIPKYYLQNSYLNMNGNLGKSCMRFDYCSSFLDIYIDNPNAVSLLILKVDDKITGRALVWNLDNGFIFMDRIYSNLDSDIETFKTYAISNNWYYKNIQRSEGDISITNSRRYLDVKDMKVTLDKFNYTTYPYMDTFLYLTKDGLLHIDKNIISKYLLRSDYGTKFDCPDCNNERTSVCVDCLGKGCKNCDFDGDVICGTCENVK